MEILTKKLIESILEADRKLMSAEHIVKVILPTVKDNRLLLSSLETVSKSAVVIISAILKYEHIKGRINLSQNSRENQEIFFIKCAGKYGLSDSEIEEIKKLLVLGKKHKDSGFEFVRAGKAIIIDDNLAVSELSRTDLEQFMRILRKLLLNARANISQVN